ncbi:MAG: transcriptional regulator NrdR [Planctomycetaceae bacterium]|jgi:transcriptional repressor NrdR|nr:transcriptional regulator NrdR [Planctomycetaceae bacterium]
MRCPFCHKDQADRVLDTRPAEDGAVVRRRRQCKACNRRFTTYERVETTTIRVIKKDGTRVPFDRSRIQSGLQRACWKRPVSDKQMDSLISKVEAEIEKNFETEVQSKFIGEQVMQFLRELDQVAYVRFASVYLKFQDVRDFVNEVNSVVEDSNENF